MISQRGQSTLEFVLMFAVIIAVWTGITKTLRSTDFFQKTYGNTWARLNNTIEFGIPDTGQQTVLKHPSGRNRHATKKPI